MHIQHVMTYGLLGLKLRYAMYKNVFSKNVAETLSFFLNSYRS